MVEKRSLMNFDLTLFIDCLSNYIFKGWILIECLLSFNLCCDAAKISGWRTRPKLLCRSYPLIDVLLLIVEYGFTFKTVF